MVSVNNRLKQIAFSVLAVMLLVACDENTKEKSMENLEKGIVKIEISGHKFDVPLRYMYSETYEKYGGWPTPKQERSSVDYLNMSVLLPDMRPYYPEDREKWEALGNGDKMRFSISKHKHSYGEKWLSYIYGLYDSGLMKTHSVKNGDVYGFVRFDPAQGNGSSKLIRLDYPDTHMDCDLNPSPEMVSPGCSGETLYKDSILVSYSYSTKYLPVWEKIDEAIRKKLDSFYQSK